ncbi:hypothetical protein N2605_27105 [Bradyrhizobium yuanmingense]|uniref:c-type cytochrome n=1 Tax=Bradyrhizobium yuanmingense TaxID=108015 RepID=UPI0021A291B5|nr:hypothetical protein [Bradyrhizobium sp. CB1024]UWU83189.1 hypothetical protein N2605_27105 [Bradyrhizobium sp. CB1024]
MPVSRERLRWLVRPALVLCNAVAVLALLAVSALIWLERDWAKPDTSRDPEAAFLHGSIGTELMPLPVAVALPVLFPEHFLADGARGDWIEQFGFIRGAGEDLKQVLPLGFVVSRYRPGSGAPSPVPFVGFSCGLCHVTAIRTADDGSARQVPGPGSISLNLFAWLDAFQAAVLARRPLLPGEAADPEQPPPYRMTIATIREAYSEASGRDMKPAERLMTALWLRQIRARLETGLPRFDEPHGHGLSRDPQVTPTGPTRTQPFRTIVRQVLQRPGNDMPVYTKIATVFSQDLRRRAQVDGTIANLYARSSLAALAAGATVENMRNPEVVHNIRAASDYTRALRAPSFAQMFPDHVPGDQSRLARGREMYQAHCFGCHGDRDDAGTGWSNGPKTDEVTPVGAIGTDPARVTFRHYGSVPERLFRLFDQHHPFHFAREEIWPQRGEEQNSAIRGYLNAPLDGVFLRAPYLHNASVLTLAELINLKPRRAVFFRGQNLYDPLNVGFISPDQPDGRRYFRFDTAQRGNSNRGHDYPWAYNDPQRNVGDLEALLDYLKTL